MSRTHSTCRRCGFGVPADSPVCPGCRRPAVDDWRRRARQLSATERRLRKERPPLHERGYRSLLPLAELARSALWISTAVALTVAGIHLVWMTRTEFTVGTTTVDVAAVARPATVLLLGVLAVTAAGFVAWAVQAYRNLPALGIRERRYWTIWLVVGWVIPGANLLVPKLLVDDIWRASSPSVPIDGRAESWQRRPVASIVNEWWCSFLLTPAVVVLSIVTAQGGLDEFEQQAAVGSLTVAAAVALVVAATAARRLVAVVTVAQARRADIVVDLREDERSARDHRLALDTLW